MEILNTEQFTVNTITLQHETEGVLIYKEWLDDSGRIIDYEVTSKDGYQIDDDLLLNEVYEFVDNL
jgi:hypothetical protein